MEGFRVIRCVVELTTTKGDEDVPAALEGLYELLAQGGHYAGIVSYTVSMK